MPRLSESINNFFTENFDCKIAFRTKNLSGILIENNTDKSKTINMESVSWVVLIA